MKRLAAPLLRSSTLAPALFAVVSALSVLASVAAQAAGRPASFVIDGNTGAVISAFNADEPRYPASLTKMMTLYIVFDLIEQGRLSYQTRIKVSDTAASAQPTKLGLDAGSDIALIDAVKSLVTQSANDMAIAIAEHIAGSESSFANLMTQKAHAIGMRASTFKNASGLPNSEQVTTARDMVTLGMRLHDDFPKHYVLFAMRDFNYAGRTFSNHNTMLNNYEGTEGIKTGYTQASGFNLVASVKRGTRHVIGAVFGGASASSRNQTMRTLLNMALFKASPVKTRTPSVAMARAHPVPEPRPASRPAPLPPAWASTTVRPEPETATGSTVAPTGTIEIARVRPVLVAPRAVRDNPIAAAAANPGTAIVADAGIGTAEARPVPPPARIGSAAAAPSDFKLPPLASSAAATVAAPVSPSRARLATQPAVPSAAPRAATPVAATAAAAMTTPARGAPPSTFQQQAASLSGPGTTPPTYRLNGPAQQASAAPLSGSIFEIQIGAYSSAAEAENQLAIARGKANDLIGSAPGLTRPAPGTAKLIWRARFSGYRAAAAGTICTELRRRQIDCMVAKAE